MNSRVYYNKSLVPVTVEWMTVGNASSDWEPICKSKVLQSTWAAVVPQVSDFGVENYADIDCLVPVSQYAMGFDNADLESFHSEECPAGYDGGEVWQALTSHARSLAIEELRPLQVALFREAMASTDPMTLLAERLGTDSGATFEYLSNKVLAQLRFDAQYNR